MDTRGGGCVIRRTPSSLSMRARRTPVLYVRAADTSIVRFECDDVDAYRRAVIADAVASRRRGAKGHNVFFLPGLTQRHDELRFVAVRRDAVDALLRSVLPSDTIVRVAVRRDDDAACGGVVWETGAARADASVMLGVLRRHMLP